MDVIPQINSPHNDDWIQYIGKYIINMGAIETTSRVIIAKINRTEDVGVYNAALGKRIEYLSVRLNLTDDDKKAKATKLFDVLNKHVKFRNSVAHSGIVYKEVDGVKIPAGLMNFTPDDPLNIGNIISIEELKGRVDESANIGALLMELQNDFSL